MELTDELREAISNALSELAYDLTSEPEMKHIPENFVLNDKKFSVSKLYGPYYFTFKMEKLNRTIKK